MIEGVNHGEKGLMEATGFRIYTSRVSDYTKDNKPDQDL